MSRSSALNLSLPEYADISESNLCGDNRVQPTLATLSYTDNSENLCLNPLRETSSLCIYRLYCYETGKGA